MEGNWEKKNFEMWEFEIPGTEFHIGLVFPTGSNQWVINCILFAGGKAIKAANLEEAKRVAILEVYGEVEKRAAELEGIVAALGPIVDKIIGGIRRAREEVIADGGQEAAEVAGEPVPGEYTGRH